MGIFSEMEISSVHSPQEALTTAFELRETIEDSNDDAIDDSSLLEDPNAPAPDEFDLFAQETDKQHDGLKPTAPKSLSSEEKKREHEAQEAKRKAEWEATQKAKREKEQAEWEKALAAGDDELLVSSAKRIGSDTERLTRRNMKISVAEHIQHKCASDLSFAKQTLHPRKNMVNCFRYINRLALAFIKQEMIDNGNDIARDGIGGDVPDDICYKWGEEYFYDMDAPEDGDKDEKFIPTSYYGTSTSSAKKPAPKPEKKSPPKAESPKQPKQSADDQQMTLWGGIAG